MVVSFHKEGGGGGGGGGIRTHKTSLNPQTVFIEVHVPSQLSERPCIFVLGVPILPPPTFLLLDFMTVPTSWYFFLFLILI